MRYIILSLENKSSHISTYSAKIIKLLTPLINPIFTKIVNDSLTSGKFSQWLKIAKVIPTHKAGCKQIVSNYHPISILPVLSKIFEKWVYKYMLDYHENFCLFNNNQYGFRPSRSITQEVLNNLQ